MKAEKQATKQNTAFDIEERNALYRAIFNRRDVRSEFLSDPVPDAVLNRILYAAHHASSVGFMQPWNFIMVNDNSVKKKHTLLLSKLILRQHQCLKAINKHNTARFDWRES